jgi:hypothetical protein
MFAGGWLNRQPYDAFFNSSRLSHPTLLTDVFVARVRARRAVREIRHGPSRLGMVSVLPRAATGFGYAGGGSPRNMHQSWERRLICRKWSNSRVDMAQNGQIKVN